MSTKLQIYILGGLEKFAFNGLRAMLTLMLIRAFKMHNQDAFQFYAVTLMMSFLVPIVSGLLIRRGERDLTVMKSGSISFLIGFILLTISKNQFLHIGISLIVLGAGFIRAGVPALLGKVLDASPGENTDAAFSMLYVFFNVGTLAGTIFFASLGEVWGWEASFFVGIISSLTILVILGTLENHLYQETSWSNVNIALVMLFSLMALMFSQYIPVETIDLIMVVVAVLVPFILVYPIFQKKEHMKAVLILSLLPSIVVFFALYEQAALSLTTFTDSFIDRDLYGLKIPTTLFQGIDPFFNIFLGILIVSLWNKLSLQENTKASFFKIVLGLVFTYISFATLSLSLGESDKLVSPWALWSFFLIIVAGELLIVPVLLSLINSSFDSSRKAFNMSLVFVLIGASMWLAQYLIRIESVATMDFASYKSLFKKFEFWAAGSFLVPLTIFGLASVTSIFTRKES
jgi:proton-dependent oligopeptide transporter, POT family